MSTLNLGQLLSSHGNPSLNLPCDHNGGRIVLSREGDSSPIWTSHGLSTGEQFVSVDVWNGHFHGESRGCAVLPAGTYQPAWRADDESHATLAPFSVTSNTLFESDFSRSHPHGPQFDGWEIRTNAESCPVALEDDQPSICGFRAAAMHGDLSATFSTGDASTAQPSAFGLVARYYSRFHHLRLTCQVDAQRRLTIKLSRIATSTPDRQFEHVLAERTLAHARATVTLHWSFNGELQVVHLDEAEILRARDAYMGGVDIVGWFSLGASQCACARMDSTQTAPRRHVQRRAYCAGIRPGNIDRLNLLLSSAPSQNICWESGIQFGHIGGSEIKFTQGATLRTLEDGPVCTTIGWRGPMPKLVEQSDDVRGFAEGAAQFYENRVVIADNVLARTTRSVGPDFDLLSRLMCGPARVALGASRHFTDWPLPEDGSYAFLSTAARRNIFPVCAGFPLMLGETCWWLTGMIFLRAPAADDLVGSSAFAWRCPSLLTASHDFRCAPTQNGWEYRYTIVIGWLATSDAAEMEDHLLGLRNDWQLPMTVQAARGQTVQYDSNQHDAPAEADDFDGCFDRRSGRYTCRASQGELTIQLDPGLQERANPIFAIRDWPDTGDLYCELDSTTLRPGKDFVWQRCFNREIWISLNRTIREPAELRLYAKS